MTVRVDPHIQVSPSDLDVYYTQVKRLSSTRIVRELETRTLPAAQLWFGEIEATEQVMRSRPGFVSANIHRGLDGTHIANYAQWRSREDFETMLRDPAAQEHMGRAAALGRFEPVLYTVADVIAADPATGGV